MNRYSEYSEYEISKDNYDNSLQPVQNNYYTPSQRLNDLSAFVSQHTMLLDKTLDLASQVTEVYAESQRLSAQVELARIKSQEEIAKMASKFQVTKMTIEKVFGERQSALQQHYKTLDYGIKNGDKEIIIAAMHQISSIVVSSPLADIQNFIEAFNTEGAPLLDF